MSGKIQKPSNVTEIELRVADFKQLLDALDPSPLETHDLDRHVETFIINSAKDLPRQANLGLVIEFVSDGGHSEFAEQVVREHFRRCAESTRRRLREHFRYGRMALCVGLTALTVFMSIGVLAENWLNLLGLNLIKESFGIAAWVSMWRPAEIFLYDWWPILAEARLYERLAAMPVRVTIPAY